MTSWEWKECNNYHARKLYPELKRIAETDLGLLTQCAVLSNLTKDRGIEMYTENISLKINAKLGGVNHYLNPDRGELTRFAGNVPIMILGADVTVRLG